MLGGWALSGAGASAGAGQGAGHGARTVAVWLAFLAAGVTVAAVSRTTRWACPAPAAGTDPTATGADPAATGADPAATRTETAAGATTVPASAAA